MKHLRKLDGLILQADCSEPYTAAVQSLLSDFAGMHQRGPQLKNGSRVRYGWVDLQLSQIENVLHICEPDFLNDITHFIPWLDTTLMVLASQAKIIQAAGCAPKNTLYTDQIILARGCLEKPGVYLERQEPSRPDDSGWYIGSTSRESTPPNENLEAIRAYQLLSSRPALMQVLALPVAYLAVFDQSRLVKVVDAQDHPVWS